MVLDHSILWIGVSLLLFFTFYGYYSLDFKNRSLKFGFGVFTALFATLVGIHYFSSPAWHLASLQLSPISPVTNIYYNFDKLIIAVCILLFWGGTRKMKWGDASLLPVFIASFALISISGMMAGYIALDPKTIPIEFFALWAVKNLFLVSLPEELFFRGFLQRELGKWNAYGGWIIASLLFGIAHIGGGVMYALLSVVAGLLYGWVYLRTNNVFLSVLTHFLINTLHILFFTYPYFVAQSV